MLSLTDIKGVGDKTLKQLNKLSIYTTYDLISHYPYRYEILKRSDIASLNDNDKVIIDGMVENVPIVYRFKNINKMQFNINTGFNIFKVIIFNRGFMKNILTIGKNIVVIGKIDMKNNTIIASDIMFNINLDSVRIIPIYKTTEGLNKKTIHTLINNALEKEKNVISYIPDYLSDRHALMDKYSSLLCIHNPVNIESTKKAMLMLKYEELFMFMLKINYLKLKNSEYSIGYNRNIDINKINEFISSLPFKLTIDQINAVNEIVSDLNSDKRMNRLLEGDVGSGKTIVSLLAMYGMVNSHYQCALMAPTEILARQHYENFKKVLPHVNIELLVGSLTQKEKKDINKCLSLGEVDILIGTHALIQDDVTFKNLGLVVTDEQHRFGVNQRNNLRTKGNMPDVLYMSATPIPRTYALTIYGDMDISMIKSKPSNRKEVVTCIKEESEIKDVLYMIKSELDKAHQVYVVAPLIEGENNDSVTNLLRQYKLAFKKYNIGMLHGKMKPKEKEEVMNKFLNKEIDILISTTVIEVGVDVRNATMIVIHNANLFGMSTLHQLRGRVGRNEFTSYCVLIGSKDNERLKIIEKTSDGFLISEEDFKLRGGGDLFGVRQSGDVSFKIADIKKDYKILVTAKEDSMEFLRDKKLDDYKYIKEELSKSINLD